MMYLCVPYSHDSAIIREQRFRAACRAAAKLMAEGKIVFSPLSHSHPIAVQCGLPTGWEFWEKFDREFIAACTEVVVLRLPGWETSVGIAAELRIAAELGRPVSYIDPE